MSFLSPTHRASSLPRWIVFGAAAFMLCLLAISQSSAVGAASPYPPNTVISTYTDPRYCNGLVSVVTDGGGNLIDVCTTNGQRIFPVFADIAPGYVASNYIAPNVAFNGAYPYAFNNNAYVNTNVAYPYNSAFLNNGAYLNGNSCGINNNCTFPSNSTVIGNTVYYNDSRFCGDGKVGFSQGTGYFCQNGSPLYQNGNVFNGNAFNGNGFVYPGNNFGFVGGYYRPLEVASTDTATTAPAPAPQAAPVAAPVTTTVTTSAAPAAPAPAANMATALMSTSAPAAVPTVSNDVHVFSVSPATAPAAATENSGRDSR